MEKEAQKRSSLLFYCYNPQEERGGKAVAYILCNISGLNIHVIKLAVKAECRRQGLGKACLQEALRYAVRERRCLSASLHVASDNAAAISLYVSGGFTEDAYLESYYRPGRHAYRMILDLRNSAVFLTWIQQGLPQPVALLDGDTGTQSAVAEGTSR